MNKKQYFIKGSPYNIAVVAAVLVVLVKDITINHRLKQRF